MRASLRPALYAKFWVNADSVSLRSSNDVRSRAGKLKTALQNASKCPQTILCENLLPRSPKEAAELYSKFDRPNLWAYRKK